MQKIGLGGGCHWCTEGVFQSLRGVDRVEQGFIQSKAPADTWAEGVLVSFDPMIVGLATLVEIHVGTHSGSGAYSPGGRYRSAIYVFDAGQSREAALILARQVTGQGDPSRTSVLPFVGFRPSEARYRNYYRSDPNRPFCRRYIDPKLDFVRRHYADIALPDVEARRP